MFNTIEEVKQFILWAKKNKLHSVDINGVKFEISPYAFIDTLGEVESTLTEEPTEAPSNEELEIMQEEFQSKEDEDLLFHSSQP